MPTWTIVLSLLAAAALWRGPLWRGRPLPGVTRPRPLGLGHRGARGPRPENTLPAFRLAFAHLDGLETDVQRTRDGVLVLWHDFACRDLEVRDTPFSALRGRAPELTRLVDLLELARAHPGTLLNLELKSRPAPLRRGRLERDLVQAVREAGVADRTLVSSFDPLALARLRLRAPGLRTALLYDADTPPWVTALAGWLHVDALHPHHTCVDAGAVRRAARRGLPLHVWTVNDPARVRALRAHGVAGIIGDDPAALAAALAGDAEGRGTR